MNKTRIIYNRLLGGWFVVRGPHQTPLSGRFDSKAAAKAYLARGCRGMGSIAPASMRGGVDAAVNAYAGDGLDARWEDDCAAICGR